MRRTHPDDPEAVQREVMNIFERHDINPVGNCLPALVAPMLPNLSAAFSPLRQTLWDRLTGTVVVED